MNLAKLAVGIFVHSRKGFRTERSIKSLVVGGMGGGGEAITGYKWNKILEGIPHSYI
jgi:hypothetical protein